MDLGLSDRVYVVTGGTRGLGRATADLLVAEGARVVLTGRRQDSVDAATTELGDRAVGVAGDNADPRTATDVVAAALDTWGHLHGALVSVGGPPPGTMMDTPDEAWTDAFSSVFLGGLRVARGVAAAIEGPGSLAFVLSSSVRQPIPHLAVSNGLRPGLAMAAKTLADELGPRDIRVNGLLPGRVATDRLTELDAAASDPDAARAEKEAQIPLRRYGRPEEFAAAAAFLLSPASSYVSGVMLPVDGGMLRSL
jgi:3-oxoacyl-[acyl-carrier protein] reductase